MAKFIQVTALASGATSSVFKLGTSKPPYTIYASGGYSVATVAVQSAPEEDGPWTAEFGTAGGTMTPGAEQVLAMTSGSIAVVEHKIEYIRFVAGGITGTADIEVVLLS
jgi:hypothetical protein